MVGEVRRVLRGGEVTGGRANEGEPLEHNAPTETVCSIEVFGASSHS